MKNIYDTNFYKNREKKLERLKYNIDKIKKRIDLIESEISYIKKIDKLFCYDTKIDGVKKRSLVGVDDTIVIDEIMYQKFPEKRLLTWSDAMEYSNWLNISKYKDWRLPRVEELERLFTKQVQRSIRGEEYFIIKEFVDYMPKEAKFWSASEENENYAWVLDFNVGYDYWRKKSNRYYALFVRDIDVEEEA